MDQAPPELRSEVRRTALLDPDVMEVGEVRVHPLGSYYMIDVEIAVDGALPLRSAHDIAHRVADRIRTAIDHVQDVKVHVNPNA